METRSNLSISAGQQGRVFLLFLVVGYILIFGMVGVEVAQYCVLRLILGIGFGFIYLILGVSRPGAEISYSFQFRPYWYSVSVGRGGVAVGLVVANLTLPPENLILQIGNQNMPWVPPIVLGILGTLLIATSNKEKKK